MYATPQNRNQHKDKKMENLEELKQLLKESHDRIDFLEKRNEVLSAKVDTLNLVKDLIGAYRGEGLTGGHESISSKLERAIKDIEVKQKSDKTLTDTFK